MKRFFLALLLIGASPAFGQQPRGRRPKAKDAVRAARSAPNEEAKERAYEQIDSDSIEDDDDVKAIYSEIGEVPGAFKGPRASERRISAAKHLSEVLAKCEQPKYHKAIRDLLDSEDKTLGKGFMGAWGAKSQDELERDTIKYNRLKGLADAAGNGKNEQALPSLRSMRKKGGQAGKLAETNIGKIGRDEDLNEFLSEVRTDPRSLVNVAGFGRKALVKILGDIDDPSIPADQKVRLAGRLPRRVTSEDLPRVQKLLTNDNPRMVIIAAEIVGGSISTDNDKTIREMLASKNRAIRGPALLAINRQWDSRYVPDLIAILQKSPDDGDRGLVATILGEHRVRDAESSLREASTKDPSSNVRDTAAAALRELSK